MLVQMVSHDQKSHVLFHFDHLVPTNGMVPVMTLLVSFDTYTSINGITCPKIYVTHCANCIDLMTTLVLLTMPLVSHDADASANNVK